MKLITKYKTFKSFRLSVVKRYSGCLAIYKPRNLERTIRILWMQTKMRPSCNSEPIFVELLNYASIIRSVKAGIKGNELGQLERNSGFANMSQRRDVILKADIVKKVFSRMTFDLGLKGQTFRPVASTVARDSMPGSTSSSVPDFITPKSSNFEHVNLQLQHWLKTGDTSFVDAYMIGVSWRTQVSRSMKLKFRQFYPLPHLVQLAERVIFDGIFKHFDRHKNTPYAYGNIFPDLSRRWLHWQKKKYIFSLDLESFDQRISNILLGHIFNFCLSHLKLNAYEYRLFRNIEMYHMNALISTSVYDGACASGVSITYRKQSGLLSGSTLTNLFGSLVNMFQLYYFMFENKISIDPSGIAVHGDDCILAIDKYVSIKDIARYFENTFKAIVSVEKSEVFLPSEKVYFLGHFFDCNGRYMNERWKLQLCISGNYISNELMSTEERVFSKFISLLSKCTDGSRIFYEYHKKLERLLNIPNTPLSYVSLSEGTRLYLKRIAVSNDLILNGWKTQ